MKKLDCKKEKWRKILKVKEKKTIKNLKKPTLNKGFIPY